MPKALTEDQIEAYERDGFAAPFDLLGTGEALALRRRIEAVEAETGDSIQTRYKIKAHLGFPWLYDVVSHPRMLDMVEDIIGPDILCWGSSFFIKEARDPGFVSWHQDSTYYGLEPCDTLTAWLAISDSTLESGCVRFLPGTHNQGIYDHEERRHEHNLLSRGQTVAGLDTSRSVPLELRAGQFSFHKEDVLHGSEPNRSDNRRLGLSIHYVAPHVRETKFPGATAMLLRGTDTGGNWGADPVPKVDYDPECLAALDRAWALYQSPLSER